MQCVFCGGELEHKKTTFIYDRNGDYLAVENVPAEVCTRCGEKTYSPEVTDELLKYSRKKSKPIKTIQMPVFDFAQQHE